MEKETFKQWVRRKLLPIIACTTSWSSAGLAVPLPDVVPVRECPAKYSMLKRPPKRSLALFDGTILLALLERDGGKT